MEVALEKEHNGYAYYIALAYCALDKDEKALEWVEKSLQARDPDRYWLRIDPLFIELRSSDQFQTLIGKYLDE